MKTPIISALSDKMSYWAEDKNFTEASKTMSKATRQAYDAKLRALVDYADGVASRPAWATDEDVALIVKSRAYESSGVGSSMCIPTYATAKTAAKEFLKFLTTQQASEIYIQQTNGSAFPWVSDIKSSPSYNGLSAFAKRKFEILEKATAVIDESAFPSFYTGGLRYDTGLKNSNFCITFGSLNSTRLNADEVITNAFNYYTEQRMGQLLQNSGLL
jgi:ABC-type glycerol-3-phosphate transport system substrate-binding protein